MNMRTPRLRQFKPPQFRPRKPVRPSRPKRGQRLPGLLAVCALFGLLAVLIANLPLGPDNSSDGQSAETSILNGQVRVVDGDTLAIGKRRIRMKGIDAPEMAQSCKLQNNPYDCGVISRDALRDKIGKQPVRCAEDGLDIYGRSLARCFMGGVDLNEWMVEQGHAVSYYDYKAAEREARMQKRGLWAGSFQKPKDWRKANTGANRTAPPAAATNSTAPNPIEQLVSFLKQQVEALIIWFSKSA